jgi:hypothetical protein
MLGSMRYLFLDAGRCRDTALETIVVAIFSLSSPTPRNS